MTITDSTDAELLARFRAGDSAALEPLFARYEEPVFRFLFGVLKDHHAAEDALQETFVQALRKADTVAADTFRGWLFTVAYRQAMLLKRKTKRLPTQTDDFALLGLIGDDPADLRAGATDDARQVRALLDQLPETQRAVISARVFDGKTFREVAAALGCPLNTALARMHDGLKKLRQLWEARHA
ncbi:rna polymerase subunit sigma-24 : RNA polymerase subunit sigma-24 OS=Anditalea andensis GN=EL17_12010 PE=4 SV=1: Sigma70_r2: Sigma70_r4_2 [Gemmata massiliana]|uniref:RNA polymerase sigma-70 region 2 domain-containing protein n=1 Tax=Gemmata massiliana TaxID=1210884 RepID=A0A6P2DK08_9BACT|nr:RNA polymerase sigma factor [Gemmata massiliana]VTS02619.1 rna polymerase subunit sigma-24 : RNA polymerase subunit sigma-24 OS=Anditalea andensis GN=EL17_12010 PE=4 SV=1: Sigma70_r2: Sigma70_r4_2 [Gemmata massiliana]